MYKTVGDVDFLDDEDLRKQLLYLSVAIFAIPLAIYAIILALQGLDDTLYSDLMGQDSIFGLPRIVMLLIITMVALPIHELIHAAFFKAFHPSAQITFGFKDGMLYAGCPGEVFERTQMCTILLAPAVIISAVFLILGVALGAMGLFIELLVLHLSGCSGDLLGVAIIMHTPACTHCEDTDYGIKLLKAE